MSLLKEVYRKFSGQYPSNFNAEDYMSANADLIDAYNKSDKSLSIEHWGMKHYKEYGYKENRPINKQEHIIQPEELSDINKFHVEEYPTPGSALDIFKDEWHTYIPTYGKGKVNLFDDERMHLFEQTAGGFYGKSILELGPLEGGQTHMMATRGAKSILSIESNARAFLRCLIIQNIFKFNANFLFGDFRPFLQKTKITFDFVLACGVLYHMVNPHELIRDMCRVSNQIAIWTMYYDEELIKNTPYLVKHLAKHFEGSNRRKFIFEGIEIELHEHKYLGHLNWEGFAGGTAPVSYWITKKSLLKLFDVLGFEVTILKESLEDNTPSTPSLTLFAHKK